MTEIQGLPGGESEEERELREEDERAAWTSQQWQEYWKKNSPDLYGSDEAKGRHKGSRGSFDEDSKYHPSS